MSRVVPAAAVRTCGTYLQRCWSSTAGLAVAGAPFTTTTTFASLPSASATDSSGTDAPQADWSRVTPRGASFGAAPVNLTVPRTSVVSTTTLRALERWDE